jgi:hypothetical protein
MYTRQFHKNGKLYMTEYWTHESNLYRLDLHYSDETVSYSTFFRNGGVQEVFDGVGLIKYHRDGSVDRKLYYLNGEVSTEEIFSNGNIVMCNYRELKKKYFNLRLPITV